MSFGCPGPGENSSSVLAPALGPVSMVIIDCTQVPLPATPGVGRLVSTCPADGLPQSAVTVDAT